jgi:hypothetical protein
MSRFYTPEKVTVCARLAGDHQAGTLLYVIMQRYRYGKATLPGLEGRWSANLRKEWFKAAGLSDSQGDRALNTLDKRGLIERKHGPWAGNPNVLYVRATHYAQMMYDAITTFEALGALLGDNKSSGEKSSPLWKLWQAWPGTILDEAPNKAGVIAEWYEQLGDKQKTASWCEIDGELKPYAQDLLERILKSDPAIVEVDYDYQGQELLKRLWLGTRSIVLQKLGVDPGHHPKAKQVV